MSLIVSSSPWIGDPPPELSVAAGFGQGQGSAGFVPSGVFGSWWADTGVTFSSGTRILSILDPVSGLTIGCPTAAWQPDLDPAALNGLPAIYYDAARPNMSLFTTGVQLALSTWTTIMVMKMQTVTQSFLHTLYDSVGGTGLSWQYTAGTPSLRAQANTATVSTKNAAALPWVDTNPHSLFTVQGGTHATNLLYRDNVAVPLVDIAVNDVGVVAVTRQLFVGSSAGISSPMRGWIFGLAIVDHVLSADERAGWQTLLKARFPFLP